MMNFNSIKNEFSGGEELNRVRYGIKWKSELEPDKVNKVLAKVDIIQTSIDWNFQDLSIAYRRLQQSINPKVFVKDSETKKLIGYAILVPTESKTWSILDLVESWNFGLLQSPGLNKSHQG